MDFSTQSVSNRQDNQDRQDHLENLWNQNDYNMPTSDFSAQFLGNTNFSSISTQTNSELDSEKQISDSFSGVAESSSTTMFAGGAIAAIQNGISNYFSNKDFQTSMQGNGPYGHSFTAPMHAEQQQNMNSAFSDLRTATLVGSSAFGPEGLAAGIGLTALETGIQNFVSPDQNTVNSTEGIQVAA